MFPQSIYRKGYRKINWWRRVLWIGLFLMGIIVFNNIYSYDSQETTYFQLNPTKIIYESHQMQEGDQEREKEKKTAPTKFHSFCKCFFRSVPLSSIYPEKFKQSTCSEFASQRGGNQKVFSYSYYNPHGNANDESHNYRYLKSILNRAKEIQKYYPGWFMRLYHNISKENIEENEVFCKLLCNFDHVDLCDVRDLPVGNLMVEQPNGRLWRFAVMGDPTISIFNSRDTDSEISLREIAAVRDWLESNKTFHVMRDHPNHKAVMLAGLWGAKNGRKIKQLTEYRHKFFSGPRNETRKYDQTLLKSVVWSDIKNDVMQHDSFTCQLEFHENSLPFPTERVGSKYVGWGPTKIGPQKVVSQSVCPVNCRPHRHKNWIKC